MLLVNFILILNNQSNNNINKIKKFNNNKFNNINHILEILLKIKDLLQKFLKK